jgi:hypothetical protein
MLLSLSQILANCDARDHSRVAILPGQFELGQTPLFSFFKFLCLPHVRVGDKRIRNVLFSQLIAFYVAAKPQMTRTGRGLVKTLGRPSALPLRFPGPLGCGEPHCQRRLSRSKICAGASCTQSDNKNPVHTSNLRWGYDLCVSFKYGVIDDCLLQLF